MMRDLVLALGLLLSTATQLRPDNSAVGPGEVCLVVWLVLSLASASVAPGRTSPSAFRMFAFWGVFALSQSVGAMTGLAIDEHPDPGSLLHDLLAYLLLACVSYHLVVGSDAALRCRQAAWFLVVFGTLALTVQLAIAWDMLAVPIIEPWFWDRLRGWSENPNQFALLCAVLGLVALHLADTAGRVASAVVALLCAALAFYVGVLTKSDSFLIVLVVGCALFLALKLRAWLGVSGQALSVRSTVAGVVVISFPLIVLGAAPFATSFAEQASTLTSDVIKADHEGEVDLRLRLWEEAFRRGMESGLLGYGPGAHIVNVPYKHESPPNFEAHNTLLDIFTQGGAIAVASVVWLMVATLMDMLRARFAALSTLVCGLVMFSTFHLIVRVPLFWFSIALCSMSISPPRPIGATQIRG